MVTAVSFWAGRRVFVTGHTGFKGSWLALWLTELGAEVTGFSLPPPTSPSLFDLADLAAGLEHVEGDVRDLAALDAALSRARPEIILHLAAQSLVRQSYQEPVDTYATNVMGTVNLLEAARRSSDVRAVICVTSDKCYDNGESGLPFVETDPMGGSDPYSSSKGCAELVASAYRRSFFQARASAGLATARAGNVIGGGDWAKDRLVPDLMRAFARGRRPLIRFPGAVRPWQHVLEPLSGYLLLAERLWRGDDGMAAAWNFGPRDSDAREVAWIADTAAALWGGSAGWDRTGEPQPHEATWLRLDCAKARADLPWRPVWSLDRALGEIVDWHRAFESGANMRAFTTGQIAAYCRDREPAPGEHMLLSAAR